MTEIPVKSAEFWIQMIEVWMKKVEFVINYLVFGLPLHNLKNPEQVMIEEGPG